MYDLSKSILNFFIPKLSNKIEYINLKKSWLEEVWVSVLIKLTYQQHIYKMPESSA